MYPYDDKNLGTTYFSKKTSTYGFGDAILETSARTTTTDGWNEDYSYFTYSTNPFFIRGGHCIGGTVRTGGFAFSHTAGSADYGRGFRSILIAL